MSIFTKFDPFLERLTKAMQIGRSPVGIQFDKVLSPTRGVIDGKEVILVGTNNYLGLTFDEKCMTAAKDAIDRHGTGTTGSRVANGNYVEHAKLEQAVTRFMGTSSTIVFSTGYQTNLAAIAGLTDAKDQIFIDADSHACIYDACRLSTASTIRFRHNNPEDLDKRLSRTEKPEGDRLVVIEGMYSMEGETPRLREIVAVKKRYGAYLYLDEAHSIGALGATGRGVCEHHGVDTADVDIMMGTFTKSFGAVGGYVASSSALLSLIHI